MKPTFEVIKNAMREQLVQQIELNGKNRGENIRVNLDFQEIQTSPVIPPIVSEEQLEALVYQAATAIDSALRYKELTLQMRSQRDRMEQFTRGILRPDFFVLTNPNDYHLVRSRYGYQTRLLYYMDMQVVASTDTPIGKPRVVMALDEPRSYSQPTPITND